MKVKTGHTVGGHKHKQPKKTAILPENHFKAFWARPRKSDQFLFQKIKMFSNSEECLPEFSIFLALLLSSKIVNKCLQIKRILCPDTFDSILSLQNIFKWITFVKTFYIS